MWFKRKSYFKFFSSKLLNFDFVMIYFNYSKAFTMQYSQCNTTFFQLVQQNTMISMRISKISRTESANHNPRELPTSTIKANHPYPKIAVLFIWWLISFQFLKLWKKLFIISKMCWQVSQFLKLQYNYPKLNEPLLIT